MWQWEWCWLLEPEIPPIHELSLVVTCCCFPNVCVQLTCCTNRIWNATYKHFPALCFLKMVVLCFHTWLWNFLCKHQTKMCWELHAFWEAEVLKNQWCALGNPVMGRGFAFIFETCFPVPREPLRHHWITRKITMLTNVYSFWLFA